MPKPWFPITACHKINSIDSIDSQVFHGFPLKNAKNFQLQLGQAPHMGMEARLPRTPAGQTKSKNSQIWKAENRRVPLVAGPSNIQQHHGDIMNVSLYNSMHMCVMWCDVIWCDVMWCDVILSYTLLIWWEMKPPI